MKKALQMANIHLNDIQVFALYDQSTVMEMISLEDLGLSSPGKAWSIVLKSCEDYKGYYQIDGKRIFVNTHGGLKADGNPLGATGGAQIIEVFNQLSGNAGKRQITDLKDLKYGCTVELVGFGTKGYVSVLGRDINE
jgi:acetyl-CoA C-acetyltransferase